MNRLSCFLIILLVIGCQSSEQDHADLIISNAKIWTVDSGNPTAQSVAVKDGNIVALGQDLSEHVGSTTEQIDAAGKLVLPGFIDSHMHTIMGGQYLSGVQLRDASTPEEFARRIGEFAKTVPKGEWILGGDWDHSLWGGELPRKDWIDELTPDNPVWVGRLDGHMGLANQVAFDIAGVGDDVEDVEGGSVSRYPDGRPSGIFKDNAMGYIFDIIPAPTMDQRIQYLDAAFDYILSEGTTTIHHMTEPDDRNFGGIATDLDAFRELHNRGKMRVRSYVSRPITSWRDVAEADEDSDEWLKVGIVKGYVDGSLGSHSAAFYEPFTDTPEDRGVFVNSEENLYLWIKSADSARIQTAIHAIGDRAINSILNIYERVKAEGEDWDRRFRIEHAQHIDPKDFPRFKEIGVIASMQPYHAIDDGRWAEEVIGPERIKTTYAFRSLLDAGAQISLGSDWFVAPPSAIEGIYAAVTRSTIDGATPDGWVPEEKISVEEAVKGYTIDAAYASYDEDVKGSLEVGKFADIIMLDQDIFEIDPEMIRDTKVLLTIVGGEVMHDARD